jgi:hypothetical protein
MRHLCAVEPLASADSLPHRNAYRRPPRGTRRRLLCATPSAIETRAAARPAARREAFWIESTIPISARGRRRGGKLVARAGSSDPRTSLGPILLGLRKLGGPDIFGSGEFSGRPLQCGGAGNSAGTKLVLFRKSALAITR